MTNIPEFSYIQPEDIKEGKGDNVVRKTWNAGFAKEAFIAFILYEASSINDSIKQKIGKTDTTFGLKNMATFLSRNHNIGGYDDSEFDKTNRDALKQISEMPLRSLIGAVMPEESQTKVEGGFFDLTTRERLGRHLFYAEQHDEMLIVMKETNLPLSNQITNQRTSSLFKIMQFKVGDLMDERKTNLDFITFFDIFDDDFVRYFGELLPVYAYKKDKTKVNEEVQNYLDSFQDKEKRAVAVMGLIDGVANYLDTAIREYYSGIFDMGEGTRLGVMGEIEERVNGDIYKERQMGSIKLSPSEITIIQRQLLPLGEEGAKRKAEEIFGTDKVIQESLGDEGYDASKDYTGRQSVDINLDALSREQWEDLIAALIEYGERGNSRSLQGKGKAILMDAVEGFVEKTKTEIFGSMQEFAEFEDEVSSRIESIYASSRELQMVTPQQRDEFEGADSSLYLSSADLLEYLRKLYREGGVTVREKSKDYQITIQDYEPYTTKYGRSVRKLEGRRKNKVKFSPKLIDSEEEGRTIRERANRPIEALRDIFSKTEAGFTKQMRGVHSLAKNNLSGDNSMLKGLIKIFGSVDSNNEQFESGTNLSDFEDLELNINEIKDEYEPFVTFMLEVIDLVDSRQEFVNKMKGLAMDSEKLDEIVDSFSLLINDINQGIENIGRQGQERLDEMQDEEGEQEVQNDTETGQKSFENELVTYSDSLYNIFQNIILNELMNPKYEEASEEELRSLLERATKSEDNKVGIPQESVDVILMKLDKVNFIVDNLAQKDITEIKQFIPKVTVAEGIDTVRGDLDKQIDDIFQGISETMAGSKLGDVSTYGSLSFTITPEKRGFRFKGNYDIKGNVKPQISRAYISYGKDARSTTTAGGDKVADLQGGTMISKPLLETLEKIRVALNTLNNAI
tara:strand:- start:6558 stop:9281 length:2724 start_codon:yes stop_codon:yes gene_type:complete